jgi:hypothetical protein
MNTPQSRGFGIRQPHHRIMTAVSDSATGDESSHGSNARALIR